MRCYKDDEGLGQYRVRRSGTGPLDSRTVRWVGSTTARCVTGDDGCFNWDNSIETATRTASSIGVVNVVNGGLQKSASNMSSQPTTLTSPGTRTPRSRNRLSMPVASRSVNATHAVTSVISKASAPGPAVADRSKRRWSGTNPGRVGRPESLASFTLTT